jgi:DHA1 family inner membrane transport protein
VLPRHLRELGFGEAHIGLVMGAFPLASILAMPSTAQLSDRAGRRAPMIAGLLLCGLSCAAMILARSLSGFFFARVGAGVGWAGVLVGGSIYTAELAPVGRLAQAMGVAGILTLVAMAIGPSLGEVIVHRASFEVLFAVAAALCLRRRRRRPRPAENPAHHRRRTRAAAASASTRCCAGRSWSPAWCRRASAPSSRSSPTSLR